MLEEELFNPWLTNQIEQASLLLLLCSNLGGVSLQQVSPLLISHQVTMVMMSLTLVAGNMAERIKSNCHGDKKLKRCFSEILWNAFSSPIQQPFFGILGCWIQSHDLVRLTNQRRLSPPQLICMPWLYLCFTSLHCMLVKASFLHAWETYWELNMD